MRPRPNHDPWFPIALLLIWLLGIWLGILGPLPGGVAAWFQKWQTLVAAVVASTVASIAAYIAFQNTTRSLDHAEQLEARRRRRKHAAVRAVLPLTLAQVSDYAARSAHALNELVNKCTGEKLPPMTAPDNLTEQLPTETLETLANFIEYSDTIDVGIIESTVAWIQIHDARLRSLVKDNRDPSGTSLVLRTNLEGYIIDAASIYAGAAAFFNYARRRESEPPDTLSWDGVRAALRNLRFWDEEYPRIWTVLSGRATLSAGPFASLASVARIERSEIRGPKSGET